ncbi:MAG: SPOR domain-containing protein [Desulfomonilia bacterium]|nr:SPOR domain-containing protein [Desulfomonilia bacterium]
MKKRRKKKPPKQSLAKNVALLFLSLGILAGASVLFSTINGSSHLSLSPLQDRFSGFLKEQRPEVTSAENTAVQKSSVGPFEYTFYDILFKKDATEASGEHFSIQIAAFKTKDRAEQLAKEINEKTRLRWRVDQHGSWSYVRFGNFSTRASAERYKDKISATLQRECLVVKM